MRCKQIKAFTAQKKCDSTCHSHTLWHALPRRHQVRLVSRFIDLYAQTISQAVPLCITSLAVGGRRFDEQREAIVLSFKYRPDHGGNPAKTFQFVGSSIGPVEGPEGQRMSVAPSRVQVLVTVEENKLAVEWNKEDWDPPAELVMMVKALGDRWIQIIQVQVDNAIVQVNEHGAGMMEWDGEFWTWKKVEE